ncbi:MAG: SRPBCC domain-containing protein [Balneolaceae bacterium]|nr:SRPBCC domain-containing protein [Balneolaceae bacterium]
MKTDKRTSQIVYRIRLESPADKVFALLATDRGRESFWAERSSQNGDEITFSFSNGEKLQSRILESSPPRRFSLTYFNGSIVTFDIEEMSSGTRVKMQETHLSASDENQNRAGWVSVLLNLKARADHGIDLRNHNPEYTWSDGYVDN